MHPSVRHVLNYFAHDHLPPQLQEIVKPYAALAEGIAARARTPEATVALRKLLESKDAAVRDHL